MFNRKLFLIALLLMLVFTLVACINDFPLDLPEIEQAIVSGYVTENQGGQVVEGVSVYYDSDIEITYTDSDGYFSLVVPPDEFVDIILTKDNYASVRLQDICVKKNQALDIEIPIRKDFNPNESHVPPSISVFDSFTGDIIGAGMEVSGLVEIELDVTAENSLLHSYFYLGNSRGNIFFEGIYRPSFEFDSTSYPNGEILLNFMVYDSNENLAKYSVPVVINNDHELVEEAICEVEYLNIYAITAGENIGLYRQKEDSLYGKTGNKNDSNVLETRNGRKLNLRAADSSTIFIDLFWSEVENADGYKIYRSFDQKNYELLSTVTNLEYIDTSVKLVPGKTTYYKVVPYNSSGTGEAVEAFVTPLPSINVFLESPANRTTDIPLKPTFSWILESSAPLPADVEKAFFLTLYDGVGSFLGEHIIFNTEEFTLSQILNPNRIYMWDVAYAEVFKTYYYEDKGISEAISVAGTGWGSLNGEFVFTTTSFE
ncbi:carboxypeptidase-like regulatory domain-containing protein [Natronospora cellulosivora (SeqCode)]